ncbi:unnamed protein product [Angiostrongylus costaricensis]|uniref:C2H2-type domain-containing protein n=1 Tax=Angiostrongylus costaricensis TaxID=334426 RepID=A0A0R3PLB9_ANGCS|nr:unnamed protein product [Angiostrongylus costaricensis]
MKRGSDEEEKFRCKLCDKVYCGEQYLKNHHKASIRSHGNGKVVAGFYVVCPGCQRKFQNHPQLERHWKFEHGQLESNLASSLMLEPSIDVSGTNLFETIRQIGGTGENKDPKLRVKDEDQQSDGEKVDCQYRNMSEFSLVRMNRFSVESANVKKTSGIRKSRICDTEEKNMMRQLQGAARRRCKTLEETEDKRKIRIQKHCEKARITRWTESTEQKERRRQQTRIKIMSRNISRRERDLGRRAEELLLAVNGSQEIFEDSEETENVDGDTVLVKDDPFSSKKSKSSLRKSEVICYAVVGIHSKEERQKFKDLLVNNGYSDVKFLNIHSPLIKAFGEDLNLRSTGLPMGHRDVFSEGPSFSGTKPHSRISSLLPHPVGDSARILCSGINGDKEILNSGPEPAKQTVLYEDRLISGLCTSNHVGGLFNRSKKIHSMVSEDFRCVICKMRFLEDGFRCFSRKPHLNIVLLACLQAQNILDMESASKAYRASQLPNTRICHKHYMQAASYIGREVEHMLGTFPERGLDQVPLNIQDDLLAYLQVYGDFLDDSSTGSDYMKLITPSLSAESLVGQISNYSGIMAQGHFSPLSSKTESACLTEISAVELLEPPARQIDLPKNVIMINPESIGSEGSNRFTYDMTTRMYFLEAMSPSSLEGTYASSDQVEGSTSPKSVDPPMIIRDQSTCLDTLNDEEFRNRFRFTRRTFTLLCETLDIWLDSMTNTFLSKRLRKVTCSTGIKIAMVLEMLAGKSLPTAGDPILQKSASEIFCGVMEAMAQWSITMIQWPNEVESKRISESFFKMTGLRDIVGCLDATIVKGKEPLNVGLVSDDKMRFRWVFAKYHADADDEMVFKQSSLCQQLRDGRRKGRLVGDDAFNSELFLMTPSVGRDEIKEKDRFLANTLCKAHLTVQEAIANWKRQFPILSGNQKSSKTSRIVVCCAALYNLARAENEPVFTAKEGIHY